MKWERLSVIIFSLLFIFSSFGIAAIPDSERTALIALYNSTQGDNWTNNNGWKTPPLASDGFALPGTEGQWYGIFVVNDHVESLEFRQNNLEGTIPPSLENLVNLKILNFYINKLSGTIPPGLGKLTKLSTFIVAWNNLTGTLPPELGNLTNMSYFSVELNNFSPQPFPLWVLNFKSIWTLDMCRSNLTGTIPPELGDITSLGQLSLGGNQLTGTIPNELGKLVNLTYLSLGPNYFSSNPLPLWILNFRSIQTLDLYGCRLYGEIPPELGDIPTIRQLNLGENQLTGTIPVELGKLTRMTYLYLGANRFSDHPFPQWLKNMPNLMLLVLRECSLTGTLPPEIGNLRQLSTFVADKNHLSGSLPPELGNLTLLNYFDLSGNQFMGTIPETLVNLTDLRTVADIGYNGLYTSNAALLAHLNVKSPAWKYTQTITPINLGAIPSTTSVALSWSPILYTGDTGGYNIYYRSSLSADWTFAGTTANKYASTFTVTGLLPGTTYYFGINTRTNTHYENPNILTSELSQWEAVTTLLPDGVFQLSLMSSPNSGASITVTPNDYYGAGTGTTTFTRTYNAGTVVTLTAPATLGDKIFSKWTVDGSDNTNTTIQVTMNANHSATAVYVVKPPVTYTLSVVSSPANGAAITVSPIDNNQAGNGTTAFTRTYNAGTVVTLTAPAMLGNKIFSKWTVNNVTNTSPAIQITMNANTSATAVYITGVPVYYTLTIESTTGTGAAILVTPLDKNKKGNGSTKFTRVYAKNTLVTLTAPAEHKNGKFSHWTLDGKKTTSSVTYQFVVTGAHKIKAFYTTPARPGLVLSHTKMNFTYTIGRSAPLPQVLRVTINGTPVSWTATDNATWLTLSPTKGTGTKEVKVAIATAQLKANTYSGVITVTAPDADKSPQKVTVTLKVLNNGNSGASLGAISSPADQALVKGNIAVSGWALDDSGIKQVNLYREEGDTRILLGTASLLEGARPDIEESFPDYPDTTRAGWGYLLQTRLLPNHGTGSFTIVAEAENLQGNTTLLGKKTFTCDNTHAISLENGTIAAYVDGVFAGSPIYTIPDADTLELFPWYASSGEAGKFFTLDPTTLQTGNHSIHWITVDNSGHTENMGNRYFSLQHTTTVQPEETTGIKMDALDVSAISCDYANPVTCQMGYAEIPATANHAPKISSLYPDENGIINMNIRQLERIQLQLGGHTQWQGFQEIAGVARLLPVGSFLDEQKGIFYWQPEPGFFGDYMFVFTYKTETNELRKVTIAIHIGY